MEVCKMIEKPNLSLSRRATVTTHSIFRNCGCRRISRRRCRSKNCWPLCELANRGRKISSACTPAPSIAPTKETHSIERELYKQCVLAVSYGMSPESLARRPGQPPVVGRALIQAHRETYRQFWKWSDAAVDRAVLARTI